MKIKTRKLEELIEARNMGPVTFEAFFLKGEEVWLAIWENHEQMTMPLTHVRGLTPEETEGIKMECGL